MASPIVSPAASNARKTLEFRWICRARRNVPCRPLGHQPLDFGAEFIQIRQPREINRRHNQPLAAGFHRQPGCLEAMQGMADRLARDHQLVGKVALVQPGPGRQPVGRDGIDQPVIGRIDQRWAQADWCQPVSCGIRHACPLPPKPRTGLLRHSGWAGLWEGGYSTSSGQGMMVDFTVRIAMASATARLTPSSVNG